MGGNFILFCNFDTRKLLIHIPIFYDDIVNQIIWSNKNIVVQKASVFENHLFSAGVVTIGDLLLNY